MGKEDSVGLQIEVDGLIVAQNGRGFKICRSGEWRLVTEKELRNTLIELWEAAG